MSKKRNHPGTPAVIITCYTRTKRGQPGWRGVVYVGTTVVHTTAAFAIEAAARRAAEAWVEKGKE